MTAHRHQWTGADFHVADGRPMMRQACACGATREVRAFDVTWNPPSRDGEGGERRSTTRSHPAEPPS
jgi:hypothetical protein